MLGESRDRGRWRMVVVVLCARRSGHRTWAQPLRTLVILARTHPESIRLALGAQLLVGAPGHVSVPVFFAQPSPMGETSDRRGGGREMEEEKKNGKNQKKRGWGERAARRIAQAAWFEQLLCNIATLQHGSARVASLFPATGSAVSRRVAAKPLRLDGPYRVPSHPFAPSLHPVQHT